MPNIHATCVEVFGHGVILFGKAGSGKSDLALRLIDPDGTAAGSSAARLVADDWVAVENVSGRIVATAPEEIRGRIEVRGVGVVSVACAPDVQLILAVQLDADGGAERIPDFESQNIDVAGVTLPCLEINAFEASAPAKIRAMVKALTAQTFANHIHMPAKG